MAIPYRTICAAAVASRSTKSAPGGCRHIEQHPSGWNTPAYKVSYETNNWSPLIVKVSLTGCGNELDCSRRRRVTGKHRQWSLPAEARPQPSAQKQDPLVKSSSAMCGMIATPVLSGNWPLYSWVEKQLRGARGRRRDVRGKSIS